MRFTVGQRRGLGIAAREPLYVVGLDAARRRVVVGPKEALATRAVGLRDLNWLGDAPLAEGDSIACFARVRSTRAPRPALLTMTDAGPQIELIDGEEGVAPGQACVIYDAAEGPARVLGGGFIRKRESLAIPVAAPLQAAV